MPDHGSKSLYGADGPGSKIHLAILPAICDHARQRPNINSETVTENGNEYISYGDSWEKRWCHIDSHGTRINATEDPWDMPRVRSMKRSAINVVWMILIRHHLPEVKPSAVFVIIVFREYVCHALVELAESIIVPRYGHVDTPELRSVSGECYSRVE